MSCMTKKEELKDNDAAEEKKASIATDNSFEWKSTQAHQQVATTSNTNQKEIYVSLLEQINRRGRFYVDIQRLCHQEEMQGNDTKTPVMNLDTVLINNHNNSDAVKNAKSFVGTLERCQGTHDSPVSGTV